MDIDQVVAEDGTCTIFLTGRLDVKAARDAESAFTQAAADFNHITLDLSDLVYIDSAGLRALKIFNKTVKNNGGSLIVINIQDDVMEVLEMTGFAALLNIG